MVKIQVYQVMVALTFVNTRPSHDMVHAGSLRMFVMDSHFGGYFIG